VVTLGHHARNGHPVQRATVSLLPADWTAVVMTDHTLQAKEAAAYRDEASRNAPASSRNDGRQPARSATQERRAIRAAGQDSRAPEADHMMLGTGPGYTSASRRTCGVWLW